MLRSNLSLLCLFLALPTTALADHGDEDDGYDVCEEDGGSSVFATMPDAGPGYQPTGRTYPEGVGVLGDYVITSGPATFGTAGNGSPSQLTVFDAETGDLVSEVPLVGENTDFEHALSELATYKSYAYAPSTQLGLLRWDFKHSASPSQQQVSTPFCSVTGSFPCAASTTACPADLRPGLPPLPNGVTVDKDGTAYVTDSLQGVVWKVSGKDALPATPSVLACSPQLQGVGPDGLSLFGANGIAVVGNDLYVSVTFGPIGATGLPTSSIYKVSKSTGALTLVYSYEAEEVAPGVLVPPIADGLRYNSDTETLFVVLGGLNAVSELDLYGTATEINRFTRTDADHPFMNPSTIAFGEDGQAFVSNHAITCCLDGDPSASCACTGAEDLFGVIELCVE